MDLDLFPKLVWGQPGDHTCTHVRTHAHVHTFRVKASAGLEGASTVPHVGTRLDCSRPRGHWGGGRGHWGGGVAIGTGAWLFLLSVFQSNRSILSSQEQKGAGGSAPPGHRGEPWGLWGVLTCTGSPEVVLWCLTDRTAALSLMTRWTSRRCPTDWTSRLRPECERRTSLDLRL